VKPLLHAKITRERKSIGDYIPAKDQATVEGLSDFAQRQRDRIAAAQQAREEERTEKVRPMARKAVK
jgi:hypothetical protein